MNYTLLLKIICACQKLLLTKVGMSFDTTKI